MQNLLHRNGMRINRDNIIITADDFGISPGVNQAILSLASRHALTNASLIANGRFVQDAIDSANKNTPALKLGVHINLTTGKSVLPAEQVPDIVNKQGYFKCGFIGLLFKTLLCNKKLSIHTQIRNEILAQINKLQSLGANITYIDGHHHIHMLPGIFRIVKEIAKEQNINRIRIVNENLFTTILQTRNLRPLFSTGILKWLLLKAMAVINNYKTDTYFFSITHSCKITPKLLENISLPEKFKQMEIMLHPGNPDIDQSNIANIEYEIPHLLSHYRNLESKSALELNRLVR